MKMFAMKHLLTRADIDAIVGLVVVSRIHSGKAVRLERILSI